MGNRYRISGDSVQLWRVIHSMNSFATIIATSFGIVFTLVRGLACPDPYRGGLFLWTVDPGPSTFLHFPSLCHSLSEIDVNSFGWKP